MDAPRRRRPVPASTSPPACILVRPDSRNRIDCYSKDVSAELIGILGVGVALLVGLGGLILTIAGWLRGDIRAVRTELRTETQALGARMAGLEQRVAGLEQRVARIEGLLEGVFRPAEAPEPAGG